MELVRDHHKGRPDTDHTHRPGQPATLHGPLRGRRSTMITSCYYCGEPIGQDEGWVEVVGGCVVHNDCADLGDEYWRAEYVRWCEHNGVELGGETNQVDASVAREWYDE